MKFRSVILWCLAACLFFSPSLIHAQSTAGSPGAQVAVAANSGAAGTRIAIEVPPGRKGIGPSLALAYNSHFGNGVVGVGWDIGVGAIARSTKRGVDYNGNDFVVAAGGASAELIQRPDRGAGQYGEKIERSFSRYIFTASGAWEVTTKDGTKYYYGTTSDSRQVNANNATFKWCLDEVRDVDGNYMRFYYLRDQGEIYLDRIEYTGNYNGSLFPTKYVKFLYDTTRLDAPILYSTNTAVRTAWRLKLIDVVAGGSRVRTYKLSYAQSGNTGRSLLTSVQQFGDNTQVDYNSAAITNETTASKLPATSFSWSLSGDSLSANWQSYSMGQGAGGTFLTGDVDGDGRNDIIQLFDNGGYLGIIVYTSNGTGYTASWSNANMGTGSGAVAWLPGDVNGDGKTDIIQLYNNGGYLGIIVYTSNGTGYVQSWTNANMGQGSGGNFLIGDVNGDGKTDIIQLFDNGGYLGIIVYTSNGTGYTTSWINSNMGTGSGAVAWLPGDVNGDGKTDIIQLYNNGGYLGIIVYTSNGTGYVQSWTNANMGRGSGGNFLIGDVNGDGKTDIIQMFDNGAGGLGIIVYTSDGGGFSATWTTSNIGQGSGGTFLAADINGDGKTDIIQPFNNNGYLGLIVYKSNGTGFTQAWANSNMGTGSGAISWLAGDVNGDGKTDVIQPFNNGGYLGLIVYQTGGAIPDLLTSVTNNVGGTTTINYSPSTSYWNTMTSWNTFSYPSVQNVSSVAVSVNGSPVTKLMSNVLPFIVQTVASISVNDSLKNVTSTTQYSYFLGFYDVADREYRGFGWVRQRNNDGGLIDAFYSTSDDIFKGLPTAQIISDSLENVYSATRSDYTSSSPSGGVYFPYIYQKLDVVFDGTATVSQVVNGSWQYVARKQSTTTFSYDGYGNVNRKYSYGDDAISGDEKDEYTDYSCDTTNTYDTANWIVSRPCRTYVKDNTGTVKASTWFDYWPGTPNLKTKTLGLNPDTKSTAINPQINYTYEYGNLKTVTDALGYQTTYYYYSTDNPTYTYPVRKINHLLHAVQTKYDERYGKPLTATDPNGNIVTTSYDHFGRPENATNPNNGSPAYKWKETYNDGLGRSIKIRTGGKDGNVIVQETQYNAMGQVYRTSLPYFENLETPRWTTYYYDQAGRVTQVTNPDSTYVTTSYVRGRTTITDADGHKKVEEKDVYGRLVKVEEYTGSYANPSYALYATTTYQYDILGNLKNVIDAKGYQTTINYDPLSRKINMTDPDMGYWQYDYNKNGNLTWQKDAKNQIIQFQYDALNRVTLKDYPTGTDVVYAYDEATVSANAKGRLTTVTDVSGMTRFNYDTLGRAVKTIKTVDNIDYAIESTYDGIGRPESVIYPDGEIVYYTYDSYGNLSQVSNIVNYASYNGFNALGQPGGVTYGNGVSTTYQYYSTNNRLFSITTNGPGGGLQNIAYGYDNAGNITGITDYISSTRNQSFIYDHLDRLTQAQSAAYGTITYQYDQIGNIENNSRVGAYTYGDLLHRHAVTQAGSSYSYSYDANGNMTSRPGKTLTYDYDNRPVSIGSATFVYDYSGQRVKKNGTVYIGKLYECTGGMCTKHIFAGDKRVASRTGTNINYYHGDYLGSSTVVTDTWGTRVQETYYYPFGETRVQSGSVTDYKYTGQEEDPETGLYYYGGRYYDPIIGRFISADKFVPNPGNPQDLNRYTYCRNNPIIYTDPTGHFVLGKFLKSVVSGIVGGAVFILSGGTAYPIFAGIMAGMSAGATSAALNGGNILQGAAIGGLIGGIGGALYSLNPGFGYAMLAGGAAYATARGGVNGLAYFGGGVMGGMIGYGGASYIQKSLASANAPAYKQYAEAYSSDAGTLTSQDEINELSRLTYAEGAGQYKVDNAMEGIAWVVRNRVETEGWPDTYYGVIHQKGQFSSVGGNLWNAAGDPSSLTGSASAAFSRALTVATGVYNGTIADPTGGALFFHSGALSSLSTKSAAFFGSLTLTLPDPLGPFYFYK